MQPDPFVADALAAAEKAMADRQHRCGSMHALAAVGISTFLARLARLPRFTVDGGPQRMGPLVVHTNGLDALAELVTKMGKADA